MDDNICEENAIKINWWTDVYDEDVGEGISKFKDTNLPLNGKYEDENGIIRYLKNGVLHNENGPSIITSFSKTYYINGKKHRIDGPARYSLMHPEGFWYINGNLLKDDIFCKWTDENDVPLDWREWTDSDKMLFALHWSDYNV